MLTKEMILCMSNNFLCMGTAVVAIHSNDRKINNRFIVEYADITCWYGTILDENKDIIKPSETK